MPQTPQNTLRQDLMLLAKHHYKTNNLIAACRLACSRHVLSPFESLTSADLTHWLVKEFVKSRVILPERGDVMQFIYDLASAEQDREFWKRLNINNPPPKDMIAERLLDKICTMRVRDEDGEFIEDWMDAQIDPAFVTLLAQYHLNEVPKEQGHATV